MRVTGVNAELIIGNGGSAPGYTGDPAVYSIPGGYTKPVPADPNFHIYLAIGQSNMAGDNSYPANQKIPASFAAWTNPRFQILNTVGPAKLGTVKGEWLVATPPTFFRENGLTPCDNFGRTLVAMTSENIRIGTVNVAVSGAQLQVYDKVHYAGLVNSLLTSNQGMWQLAYAHSMSYPYKALVHWGREAQKVGVIKGIIMMHGEAGAGSYNYADIVTRVYTNLLEDLDLPAGSIPFVAGQPGANFGVGASTRTALTNLANQHAWFHVFETNDLGMSTMAGDGSHYSPQGMIDLGERFAETMYPLVYGN